MRTKRLSGFSLRRVQVLKLRRLTDWGRWLELAIHARMARSWRWAAQDITPQFRSVEYRRLPRYCFMSLFHRERAVRRLLLRNAMRV